MVEHQRLNSPAVTFSASLPTFLATTASAVIARLQSDAGAKDLRVLRERIDSLRRQLEKSDWVFCHGAPGNPVLHLTIQAKHIQDRALTRPEQELLLQECVNEVSPNHPRLHLEIIELTRFKCLSNHSVLVTRLKSMPVMDGLYPRDAAKEYQPEPAIKVCATTTLSVKEIEKAGSAIRHAITAVMKRPKWQRGTAELKA